MRSTKYQFQINLLSSKAAAWTISPLPQLHTKTTRSNFIQIHHEIGQNFFPLMISIMGFTIEITLNCLRISINYAFLWHITWYLLLLLISIKGISLQPEWVSGLMTWRFEIKLSLKSSLPCYCLDSDRKVNKKRQDQLEIGNKAPENFSLTYKSSRNGCVLTLWLQDWESPLLSPLPATRTRTWLCSLFSQSLMNSTAQYRTRLIMEHSVFLPPRHPIFLTGWLRASAISKYISVSSGALKHHEPAGNRFSWMGSRGRCIVNQFRSFCNDLFK